jgi:hypothetical protein
MENNERKIDIDDGNVLLILICIIFNTMTPIDFIVETQQNLCLSNISIDNIESENSTNK